MVGANRKVWGANLLLLLSQIFHENCMKMKHIGPGACTWICQCHIKRKSSIISTRSLVSRKLSDTHIAHILFMAQLSIKSCFCRVSVISVTNQAVLLQTFFRGKGTTDNHEIKISVLEITVYLISTRISNFFPHTYIFFSLPLVEVTINVIHHG